ncbi:unnamed protein product [Phyllotreta striolata]|uniref:Ionotropic receptor 8a n=1 Tax=Phyllotreta striolata TaxID=444603 RepID=A0A9N9TJ41_PHYSR|nr:unnamed protein product [Phyllotreta striolata]
MWAIFLLSCLLHFSTQDAPAIKIILMKEKYQDTITEWYNDFVDSIESLQFETIELNIDTFNKTKACDTLSQGAQIVLDITWGKQEEAEQLFSSIGIPYVKIDVAITPYLDLLDSYLDLRNATDITLIFEDPWYVDQTLHYWMNIPKMRMIMTDTLTAGSLKKLRDIRPIPNNFALFATTENMNRLFKLALRENLVILPERWNLVFLDFHSNALDRNLIAKGSVNILTLNPELCCYFTSSNDDCNCPRDFDLRKHFLQKSLTVIADAVSGLLKEGTSIETPLCDGKIANEGLQKSFDDRLFSTFANDDFMYYNYSKIRLRSFGSIGIGNNGSVELVVSYDDGHATLVENKTIQPIKAFYSIGVSHALPWSYKAKDPETGEMKWTGYCVDFAEKIAEVMNFNFEIVEPKEGTFGEKVNGVWNGVVGDLVSGRTDLAITALIMTADKEEVIDFVAPYFEQTGITIVMRKPVRKTSLFKFMTVLKLEVWFSIVAALIVTGFMIWFLDKYSPYSARNNKKAYPYPCREFTLKESFWFALTSFTPQGGGEAPKSLSGRTLVAAYWLFVVLMLATFTANLAAFLTVERMQAPVQSLEQLARQSRINYTVVRNSQTHRYFINMKYAEDILYKMWKELTLNASTDDKRYRVWDYPIREQYGHILLAINDSNPVDTAEEGFRNVDEHLDADYAFIHDSSEIKYEISMNCNLTEVGEVFAEKPYAVAVQQGSHMQDELSKVILKLQKDRFFEGLQEKYWNHSAKGNCPSMDDNEGITLESLGGVFIATLFGLALAMITLIGEVIYYRKKLRERDDKKSPPKLVNSLSLSPYYPKELKPMTISIKPGNFKETLKSDDKLNSSNLILYPRGRNRISHNK